MAKEPFLKVHKKELIWFLIVLCIILVLFNRVIYTGVLIVHERLTTTEEERIVNRKRMFDGAEKAFEGKGFEAALRRYRGFLMRYPDSGFGQTVRYKIAESLKLLGNRPEAIEAYRSFIARYPDSELSRPAIEQMTELKREEHDHRMEERRVRFKMAEEAFNRKDFQSALRGYEQFIEQYPENSVAETVRYKIAESRRFLGDHIEALVAYHLFLQMHPESPLTAGAALHIAELYRLNGMRREALAAYEAFIREYPGDENIVSAVYWAGELRR